MKYLYPNQIIYLHKEIVKISGGSHGIRDKGLLESAVYRPQASFGGQELFQTLFAKAAAIGHGIIQNHPFVDGNKRVGYEAARLMLRLNGYDIQGSFEEKYSFVMKLASGKVNETQFAEWIEDHSRKI